MSAGAILVIVHALGGNGGILDVEHFPDRATCDAAVVSLREMERELAEPPRWSRDGGAADGSGVPR